MENELNKIYLDYKKIKFWMKQINYRLINKSIYENKFNLGNAQLQNSFKF